MMAPHSPPRSREDEWLWGWDPTPGIVSVWAEGDGRATVWRRIAATGELVREEARFRPWRLLERLDDLQHLGAELAPDGDAGARITWRELDGPGALRFLVRAADLRTLTSAILHGAAQRLGRAFTPEDYAAVFADPVQLSLFGPPIDSIHTILSRHPAT